MQDRLLSIGLKPINNVVDVTNFVQQELAQPLHAFDADKLTGDRIVVRMALANEAFITLDGKERKLHEGDLVIADAEKAACMAGVFGGAHSGVSDGTTTIFLESACFDPATIRRTARRHGLNTDASFRFERGVDPGITVYALKRAALLLKEVAGARISSGITDVDHSPKQPAEVLLRFAHLEQLSGLKLDPDTVVRLLEGLDFTVRERNAEGVRVAVPCYRVDVYRAVDVIEEVMRIHGLDNVPLPEQLRCPPMHQPALTAESLRVQLGAHLVARGFREIMTPSLVSAERAVALVPAEELVQLANPLSSELDVLRPTMLFGALQAVAHNINRQQRDLRFFERGRTYLLTSDGTRETETLSFTLTGRRWRENWRADDRAVELADAQEEVSALLARLGLGDRMSWKNATDALMEEAVHVHVDKRAIGFVGRVAQSEARKSGVAQAVFHVELNEEALLDVCRTDRIAYAEVPRYPAVRRDLSLLLSTEVRFEQLKQLSFQAERKLLREVDLFDVYEGDKLPAGRKSYALSFTLQDAGGTLTDEQVEKAMGRIRAALEKEVGAELRG